MTEEARYDAMVRVAELRVGNENLVSRQQVDLLLENFEPEGTILLDFEGIDRLGQAFAHQLFCVVAKTNPRISLSCVNVSPEVQTMIDWARSQPLP